MMGQSDCGAAEQERVRRRTEKADFLFHLLIATTDCACSALKGLLPALPRYSKFTSRADF